MRSTSLNTTREALAPGGEIEYGTSLLKGGAPQLIGSNVQMGVVDRIRMGENLGISTHKPKGLHATERNDNTSQGTDLLCNDSDGTNDNVKIVPPISSDDSVEIVPPVSDMPDYNQKSQLKPSPQHRAKSKEKSPVCGGWG